MSSIRETIAVLGDWLASIVFFAFEFGGVQINLIVLWLLAGMIFFTLRLGFINFRGFPIAIKTLRGQFASSTAPGLFTPFQALATALSGTVGLGNIAGVALAIALGGPGAAFWMIVVGFLAMSLKFAEVTLAVKYRRIAEDGDILGGPMWYLKRGLEQKGLGRLGLFLANLYAIFALFALIQIFQVNQSYAQVSAVMGLEGSVGAALAYGFAIAALAALVIVGGARWVGALTSRIMPFMCGLYLFSTAAILVANWQSVGDAIALIVRDAFSPSAAVGGVLGAFVAGMRRAVYSNEAGVGTATIAHAMVKTDEPVSEGFVALIEPFVDTVIVCTATALLIVVTGVWDDGYDDITMTSAAFGSVASWFPSLLAICVVLFALSTVLATGFYARQVCGYLFADKPWATKIYLAIFCGALPLGTLADVSSIIAIVDSFFFLLTVPNLIGLYLLRGVIVDELSNFRRHPIRDEAPDRET